MIAARHLAAIPMELVVDGGKRDLGIPEVRCGVAVILVGSVIRRFYLHRDGNGKGASISCQLTELVQLLMPVERVLPLKKRANIEAYFTPLKRPSDGAATTSRRPQQQIQGLSIENDLITQDEETSLLNFIDCESWRTDLSRRTIHYGGTYCLMPPADASPEEKERINKQIFKAKDIPQELDWLVERMIAQGLYDQHAPPRYCIV